MLIGDYLKKKRKEKGLSLRAVAKISGMSHSNVSDIEKGIVKREESILKIMASLGLNENEKLQGLRILVKESTPVELQEDVLNMKKALILKDNPVENINHGIDLSDLNEEEVHLVKLYVEFLKSKRGII